MLAAQYHSGSGGRADYAQAAEYYEQACSLGEGSGCRAQGDLYRQGLGVSRDEERACKYYGRAREADDAAGQ